MKTSTFKIVFHTAMICATIITTVIITKNIINNVKYLYGLQPAGSGITCFFDFIQ